MGKNVFIVFAHPERNSLNGCLLDVLVDQLTSQGDHVKVSDLYRMNWKTEVDIADFPAYPADQKFNPELASKNHTANGSLTKDVVEEQQKLLWADTILFVFPIWWFNLPAILKGYIDRVFSNGFAYNYSEHPELSDPQVLKTKTVSGRNASLVVTLGGSPENAYKPGNPGDPNEVVSKLLSATLTSLEYSGINVIDPLYLYDANTQSEAKVKEFQTQARKFASDLPN